MSEARAETGAAAGATGAGKRSAAGEVEIAAPIERVWRALTEAAELERWFPLEARVEPGPDGSIYMSWKNEFAGESKILVWDEPYHLRTSWGFEAVEGEAQVTDYVLESRGGGRTVLRVITSGFPDDAQWDAWVEGTVRGWAFELRSLKHYLENYAGRDRTVVYLRRRVALNESEAWARLFGPGGVEPPCVTDALIDHTPPLQYAAVLAAPEGALFRASLEPGRPATDTRDVTLWLAVWDEAGRRRLPALERAWRARLERLFPEGHAVG
ncbi:MAG: SRPBCC family protein [Longimicrobiales bacterium]